MIKKRIKKILSFALALAIVATTIIPNAIFAATPDITERTKSYTVNTYHFYKSGSEDVKFTNGPYADYYNFLEGYGYIPPWRYSDEYQEKNPGNIYLEPECFRTSDGKVTYCLNLGKAAPEGITMDYEMEELSIGLKRVIQMGYPSKSGEAYGVDDASLEWATAVALKIVEGTVYAAKSGNTLDSPLTLEAFNEGGILTVSYPIEPVAAQAYEILEVIKKLVNYANDESIIIDEISITDANDYIIAANKTAYTVGPFKATLNSSSTAECVVKISGASDDYKVVDVDGNEININNINFGDEFYITGNTTNDLEINIAVYAAGLESPTQIAYSTEETGKVYYDGDPVDCPYQKMYVFETVTLQTETKVNVKVTPVFNTKLTKTDLVTGEPIPGATIEIKDENGKPIEGSPFVTDENGEIQIKNIPAGTYSFKEIIAPDGYILNETTSTFTIDENGNVSGTTTLTNEQNKVVITKTDLVTGEPVPGATIEIKDSDDNVIATKITDENGEITLQKLPAGTYTFKEIIAPDGYIINETECIFTIDTKGEVTGTTTLTNEQNKVVISKTDLVTGEPVPGATIEIKDSDDNVIATKITDENGEITLQKLPAGTYTFKETIAPDGYILNESTCTFEVTEKGTIEGTTTLTNKPIEVVLTKTDLVSGEPVPGATIEIKDSHGNTYLTTTTDKNGEIKISKIPAGEYSFVETIAPAGYIINKSEAKFTVNADGTITGTTTITNEPNTTVITKTDLVSGEPVPGATIEIKNSDGNVIYTEVTNNKGQITISKLPVGTYTFHETIAPEGYILSDEIATFTVTEDGITGQTILKNAPTEVTITKVDATNATPLPGAVIEIRDSKDNIVVTDTTDEKGTITVYKLPAGDYTFTEITSPDGYVLSKETCNFSIAEDGTVTGTTTLKNYPNEVVISKIDAVSGKAVPGATIEILDSEENTYFKGETDENGQISFNKVPAGTYTFHEVIAPNGYVLSDETCQFTVNPDGTVSGTTTLKNMPTEVVITKTNENNSPLAGAKFEIRKGNTIIAIEETNSDGEIVLTNIDFGEYSIREISAPTGYALDTTTYKFTLNTDGTISGTTNIVNKEIVINIYKKDLTTGEVVEGAELVVKDKDGKEIIKEITDNEGKITISKIPAGKYTIQETKAPDGYQLNTTIYTFTVNEDGSVEGDFTVYDKKLPVNEVTTSEEPSNQETTTQKGTNSSSVNEKVETGDTHTTNGTIFLLAGVIVLAGASIFLFKKKKY